MEDRCHRFGRVSLNRLILIAPILFAKVAFAQSVVPTNDGTDTQITQDAGQYSITGGQLSADGQNLFHSFHQFSLTAAETADFVAPTGTLNILGRVNGGQASVINGLLQLSGSPANLYLLNPAGILFGPEAALNLPGNFLATTADTIEFHQGTFSAIGSSDYTNLVAQPIGLQFVAEEPGAIVNTANLRVDPTQNLSLVSSSIVNTGTLTAPGGSVTLATIPNSQRVHLGISGNILGYEFIPSQATALLPLSLPELLTAALPVTHTGIIVNSDNSIELQSGLTLTLDSGTLISTGNITVSSSSNMGGTLTLLGRHIGLLAGDLDATGLTGGGYISIGGSRQGNGPLPNAAAVYVGEPVTITADALATGHGGEIIIWSDNTSRIHSNLSAQGGLQQGNGGFIETSSREFLEVTRAPLVGATNGLAGTWVLDPLNLTISEETDNNISAAPNFKAEGINSILSIDTLNTALSGGGDVVISTSNSSGPFAGNITLSDPLIYTAGTDTTLELQAAGNIVLTSDITPDDGSEALNLALFADTNENGDGSVILTPGVTIDTAGGDFFTEGNNEGAGQSAAILLLNDSLITTSGGDVTLIGHSSDTPGILVRTNAEIDTTGSGGGVISLEGFSDQDIGILLRGTLDAGAQTISLVGESVTSVGIQLAGEGTTNSSVLKITGTTQSVTEAAIEATRAIMGDNITLEADGSIEVDYIDATGDIDIFTNEFLRAFGEAPMGLSIFTRNGGSISITHGGGNIPFVVGDADVNGTAGGIANSPNNVIEPISVFFDDFEQGDITIATEEVISSDCLEDCNIFDGNNFGDSPLEEQLQSQDFLSPEVSGQIIDLSEESFALQDNSLTNEYARYLGITADETLSLEEVQQRLSQVTSETGHTPAIVYASFIPANLSISAAATKETLRYDSKQDTDVLELVMVTAEGTPFRQRINVTRSDFDESITQLHRAITSHSGFNASRFLNPAQKLNHWLIEPLKDDLDEQNITNISFVLPSGLRSIPLAALHDGDSFLIERYSIGMMPSVGLTDMRYTDIRGGEVLAMGASTFADQPSLPAVPMELATITETLWPGKFLLNETFTPEAVITHRQSNAYNILHLATHSEFQSGDVNNSYIQFWNGRLGLDQLRSLRLNAPPVDLLVLSSCQTALGSDEAELGFAGLAVQAGVKTAMASLWKVDDMGTAGLMTEFYDQLQEAPLKAEALREAQLAMIKGEVSIEGGYLTWSGGQLPIPVEFTDAHQESFSHPYFWAAFTLIGNPW